MSDYMIEPPKPKRRAFRDSWEKAKRQPAAALGVVCVVIALLLTTCNQIKLVQITDDLKTEQHNSIQRNCDMGFANGQAVLDTASASSTIPPEVIKLYRENLQRNANAVLRRYDPKFHCTIPTTTIPSTTTTR